MQLQGVLLPDFWKFTNCAILSAAIFHNCARISHQARRNRTSAPPSTDAAAELKPGEASSAFTNFRGLAGETGYALNHLRHFALTRNEIDPVPEA